MNRLENAEHDLITENDTVHPALSDSVFRPFRVQPQLWVDRRLIDDPDMLLVFWNSVTLINDALPPEFQLVIAGTLDERPFSQEGDIFVEMVRPGRIGTSCGSADAVACAIQYGLIYPGDRAHSAEIFIPDDMHPADYSRNLEVITHEYLHALGIVGHLDSIELPDSIMGPSGDYFPNPGFVLHRIDRELLQILYMSQETEIYNDWGEWSDTTLHVLGEAEDGSFRFGVALFNGLPQPWARGALPGTDLAENRRLRGRVSWEGALIGFSGPSPLAGDAGMTVDLAELQRNPESLHDLRFRDIYYLNRAGSDGVEQWFSTRNMDYEVAITGNGFMNAGVLEPGGDRIIGYFFGDEHQAMGGTIKRTDMVGAFGGNRDE